VIEGAGERVALLVDAGQFQDALLGVLQLAVAALEQGDGLLIAGQRFLKADLALFQLR
jgi:hypothetical protein